MVFYTTGFKDALCNIEDKYMDYCDSVFEILKDLDDNTNDGGNVFTSSLLGKLFGKSNSTDVFGNKIKGHNNWGHYAILEHLVSINKLKKTPLYSKTNQKKPICNVYYIKSTEIDKCYTDGEKWNFKKRSTTNLLKTLNG